MKQLQTLVASRLGEERCRRFHRRDREQLEQVVLHHIAQRARPVVVATPLFDADGLGHCDLHVVDVATVPDRLENPVAEAERDDVLDRLLAQGVIDPVDLRFQQDGEDALIEGARRVEIPPERLLDDDSPSGARRLVSQSDRGKPFDDGFEETRWRGQIEQDVRGGIGALGQMLAQPPVGRVVVEAPGKVRRALR